VLLSPVVVFALVLIALPIGIGARQGGGEGGGLTSLLPCGRAGLRSSPQWLGGPFARIIAC
jgi:hypothetical protein